LGLALSQEIAQEHGGELTCASALGQGTTFTLRLPL
jgi:signal transduction histidine kinase